jgi:hypothetical protein
MFYTLIEIFLGQLSCVLQHRTLKFENRIVVYDRAIQSYMVLNIIVITIFDYNILFVP